MKSLLFLFLLIVVPVAAQQREVVVVIDPGHGGSDPGHLPNDSGISAEKELNLKIARYFGSYIEKYLQNVKVIYTRSDDTYPSLDDRVGIANNNDADYFISIHCNGNERRNVHGTETHVHSMNLSESVEFAKAIEKQFSSRAGRKSRGVKDERDLQHSLQVLKFTNMTSVLVECGFVTNDKEAEFLNSTYGQEIIASAIFRAFRETIEKSHPQIAFRKKENSSGTNTASNETESSSTQFGIQIASSKEPIETSDSYFKKSGLLVERRQLNTTSAYKYIYVVGNYSSRDEAKTALPEIQRKGFKDAIIITR